MLTDTDIVKSSFNINTHKLPLHVTADRGHPANANSPSAEGSSIASSQGGASTGGTFGLNTGQHSLPA